MYIWVQLVCGTQVWLGLAYSSTQEELGSVDAKPRCIWVQLVRWTQVWLGSVVCWIQVYMGLTCTLNPSVVGFSQKKLGTETSWPDLELGANVSWPNLEFERAENITPFWVMTFVWWPLNEGFLENHQFQFYLFTTYFFFIIATIKLLPYLLLACDIVFFITAMNFVQQNCPTRSSLLIFFINHHNPFV
jgi:hypothetical protein